MLFSYSLYRQNLLKCLLYTIYAIQILNRIFSVKTALTEGIGTKSLNHSFQTDKRKGICSNFLSDFFKLVCARNQFVFAWSVYSKIARKFYRWWRNAEMHFAGTCTAENLDEAAACCTAHDRIINNNNAFSFEVAADSIQFYKTMFSRSFWVGAMKVRPIYLFLMMPMP